MITLNRLYDQWKIKELLTKDSIYLKCYPTDDLYSLPIDVNSTAWFEVKDDDKTVGLGILKEFSGHYMVFHGGIYKEFRGTDTVRILSEFIKILKEQGIKLLTTIPSTNKEANNLMSKINYTKIYTLPDENDDIYVYAEKI